MKLTITALSSEGAGIAKDSDGKVWFVGRGLPGDVVEGRVRSDHARWGKAEIERFITKSAQRIPFACPYKNVCNGCLLGELPYAHQLAFKSKQVEDAFLHIAHQKVSCCDIQPSPATLSYRNKIELSREKHGNTYKLGFHGKAFIPIAECLAFQGPSFLIQKLEGALNYLEHSASSHVYRVSIRSSKHTGEVEVALWTETGPFERAMATRVLSDPAITSLVRVQTKGAAKARRVVNVERLSGKGTWTEVLGGFSYSVSAPSFFQVNTDAAENMVRFASSRLAKEQISHALDLYCGVGTFTLAFAKECGHVLAIEAEKTAVRDLKKNIEKSHLSNIEVIGGDVGKQLKNSHPDLILVDPPRAGLSKPAMAAILQNEPRELIYISCNPATLARDAKELLQAGYAVDSLTPFDLFPNTPHVETVCIFRRETTGT